MPNIRLIEYGSCDYHDMVVLRDNILRRPLGLTFSTEYLRQEMNDFLIGCFDGKQIVGCCILTPVNNDVIQLRQMAVDENQQGKGTGSKILRFAEERARKEGFSELTMHARDVARPFYEKNGYSARGDIFTEVGIDHIEMYRKL
ncbi:GNAT family N-acetyltransferase [Chitinophaga pollutisoli]|uniref:GNAT family N-acetyltransferase n=1 Tax=Chitinophaga pollutisoli TaxID=3133966 RepID=A0ABZ2YHZ0_9BACT